MFSQSVSETTNFKISRKRDSLASSLRRFGAFLGLLSALSLPGHSFAQSSQINVEPNVEWQKLVSDDHNLSQLGDDLMGDMIDYNSGSVTFEHTDVEIPGNNALSVAIKRRLTRGILYDQSESSGFGDWEIVAPRIVATTAPGTNFRTGNRCSGVQFQTLNLRFNNEDGNIDVNTGHPYHTKPVYPHEYTQGLEIETLEYGSEKLLRTGLSGAFGPYSSADKYVTRSNFKVSCLQNISGGGEGFLAHSPDGFTYRFDQFYERRTQDDILSNYYGADGERYRSIIAATEVTDVHGNWVRYEYDAHDRLIRIHSNDLREITISYDGLNEPITSITANNRTWTYSYASRTQFYDYVEWGGVAPFAGQSFYSLANVMLPDGRQWLIENSEMNRVMGLPGCTKYARRNIGGDTYSLYMKHPSGTWGLYKFDQIRRRAGHDMLETASVLGHAVPTSPHLQSGTQVDLACPTASSFNALIHDDFPNGVNVFNGEPDVGPDNNGSLYGEGVPPEFGIPGPIDEEAPFQPTFVPSRSANLIMSRSMTGLVKKVLSPTLDPADPLFAEAMVWEIEYQQSPLIHYASPGDVPAVPASDRTNWTRILQPDNTEKTLYYHWDAETFGGEMKRDELRESPGASAILQANDYSHVIQTVSVGQTDFLSIYPPASQLNPVHQTQSVTALDGDQFTRDTEYDLDPFSATYSFGNPTAHEFSSNVSTTPRRIETSYEHNTNLWILGLPKTQSLNGTQAVSYTYNGLGLKTAQSRYTQSNYYTFTYNADGTVASATDALGHVTEASSWKRGSPQTVRRWLGDPGGAGQWITTTTAMDDNGWVTSFTDANGNQTLYQYDSMGRIEMLDPPGTDYLGNPNANTHFVYDFNAVGDFPITQTVTKGSATTTLHYDNMQRPRRSHKSSGAWSSIVETDYDNMGRAIFVSNPSTTVGTHTQYDALGRKTASWLGDRLTTALNGDLVTTTSYLDQHRVQVTDPAGHVTTRHLDGYGGPNAGELLQIEEPGRRTTLTRNDFGLIMLLTQEETAGSRSVTQEFRYDADNRLCTHYVPEHGESRFRYHADGRLYRSSKGESKSSSGCPANTWSHTTVRRYDSLGRVKLVYYGDHVTLDIENFYDANGNLLQTRRGQMSSGAYTMSPHRVTNERHRTYDALNNVTAETQQIDGAHVAFQLHYEYDANGFLRSRRYPSNAHYEWTNDGFGHQQHLRQGTYYYADNITYHPDSSLAGYDMGNGQSYTRTLDPLQRTDRLRSIGSGLTALDLTYSYNSNGQIASILDASTAGLNAGGKTHTVTGLSYDGLGQLTQANGWWGPGTYTYDGLGNIRSKSLGSGSTLRTVDYTYHSASNQVRISNDSLSLAQGGTGYRWTSHDDRGNIWAMGTHRLSYDLSDQVIGMSDTAQGYGPTDATFQYNGEGKRVQMTMNGRNSFYVYDVAGRLILSHKEHDGEGVERLFLESGQALAKWTGTKLTYFHTDHLGTPIRGTHGLGGTETIGAEVFQDFSTPFGMQPTAGWHGVGGSGFDPATGLGSNCGVTGFTTHVKDCESGLQYMQARYYDPVLSRFTSVDPVGFLQQPYTAQINRYAYTWNNPINATDPNGEFLKIVKSVYNVGKRTYKNGGNLKSALKDEAMSYVENGATLLDPNASLGDKAFAVFDLATGFGDEAKGAKRLLGGNCCFVAGTLVETKDGLRPIEKIEIGDQVWARDVETGETALKPVTDLIRRHERVIWTVEIESLDADGQATTQTFDTTDDHPWWITGYAKDKVSASLSLAGYAPSRHGPVSSFRAGGRWIDTDALRPGMVVTTRNASGSDGRMTIRSVMSTDRIEPTFNLTVADFETYFVGEQRVLVHNCRKTKAYDVGPANQLRANSARGDGLDIHHAPQSHPASQVIGGFDPKTAPSIALPAGEHRAIPTMKGEFNGSARDLLAKDIRDLRANTNTPNSSLQSLIKQSKERFPELNK